MPEAEEVFTEGKPFESNYRGWIVISLLEKGVLEDGERFIKRYYKWLFLDPLEFGRQVKLKGI